MRQELSKQKSEFTQYQDNTKILIDELLKKSEFILYKNEIESSKKELSTRLEQIEAKLDKIEIKPLSDGDMQIIREKASPVKAEGNQ